MKARIEEFASELWEIDEEIAEDIANYIFSLRDGDEETIKIKSQMCDTICSVLKKYFLFRECE